MKNLRIGIDIRALDTKNITGVDTYLRALLRIWAGSRIEHKLILFGTPKLAIDPEVLNLVSQGHIFVPQPWPSKILNGSMLLFNYPRLDQLMGGVDVFFLPNTMFHAFSPKVQTVITFHDLSFERLKYIYSLKHNIWHRLVNPKKEAKRASKIIAVSRSTAEDIEKLYGVERSKIEVVPLGVDEPIAATADTILPDKYILFLGSVEPRKNTLTLIRAFEQVADKHPGLHLVLAGSFFPQKDAAAITAASLNSKILIYNNVSKNFKASLYQNASLLVLPSFYEGFGLPILEAQSYGVPVITSVGTSMPEVAQGSALLVNPFNISELAQAIDLVLTNETIRHNLVSRGRESVAKFTWEKTAAQTLEVIERAAN